MQSIGTAAGAGDDGGRGFKQGYDMSMYPISKDRGKAVSKLLKPGIRLKNCPVIINIDPDKDPG
ncbi:hypothetical protein MASR2M15_27400 [Anaerolineales bacterium]